MSILDIIKSRESIYPKAKLLRDARLFLNHSQHASLARICTISKIYHRTMLPPARLFNICDLVEKVNQQRLPGDIAECGVWSGGALALLALWDMRTGMGERNYLAFDSFEGLPPPTFQDGSVFQIFKTQCSPLQESSFATLQHTGICEGDSADNVRQFFHRIGIPRGRSKFHVGWFQDTVPVAAKDTDLLAILRIDGDWYESTKVCLDNLMNKVCPGGYVIVDDYGCFEGCQRAVDEFRSSHNITTKLNFVDEHCVWFCKPS